jgi:thioredoxin-like negative regulator of GroEL
MLEGLDLLYQARAVVPQLRAYHLETLVLPLKTGNTQSIERRAALWLRSFPADPFALDLLARSRFKAKNFTGCVPVCLEILKKRPGDGPILKIAALCYRHLGKWDRVVELMKRYGTLAPRELEGHRLLVSAAYELGDQETGVAAAEKILEIIEFPGDKAWDKAGGPRQRALLMVIGVLHRFRQYSLLATVAAFYRQRDPDNPEAVMAEGIARLELGEAPRAEPLLRKALASSTNLKEVSFHLGLCLVKQEKYSEAANHFTGLLLAEPQYFKCYYQLGTCLVRLGKKDLAASMFEKSRRLNRANREFLRARELRGAGKPVEATLADSKRYLFEKRYAQAEKTLLSSRSRREPQVLLALIEMYRRWLRLKDARRILDELSGILGQANGNAILQGTRLLWEKGKQEEAISLLEKRVATPNADNAEKFILARWLLAIGRPAGALALLEPVRRGADDREASQLLGRAMLALNRPEAALGMFQSISSGDPRWSEWEMNSLIATAMAATGKDLEKARLLIDETPTGARGSPAEFDARLAVLAELEESGKIDARRDELAGLKALRNRKIANAEALSQAKKSVGASVWKESLVARRALVALYLEAENRPAASLNIRLALQLEPNSLTLLRQLLSLQDDPADIFERWNTLRALGRLHPADTATAKELKTIKETWKSH